MFFLGKHNERLIFTMRANASLALIGVRFNVSISITSRARKEPFNISLRKTSDDIQERKAFRTHTTRVVYVCTGENIQRSFNAEVFTTLVRFRSLQDNMLILMKFLMDEFTFFAFPSSRQMLMWSGERQACI